MTTSFSPTTRLKVDLGSDGDTALDEYPFEATNSRAIERM
jgi:hypothetical protein